MNNFRPLLVCNLEDQPIFWFQTKNLSFFEHSLTNSLPFMSYPRTNVLMSSYLLVEAISQNYDARILFSKWFWFIFLLKIFLLFEILMFSIFNYMSLKTPNNVTHENIIIFLGIYQLYINRIEILYTWIRRPIKDNNYQLKKRWSEVLLALKKSYQLG